MRVDNVVIDPVVKLREILLALDNRLTPEENFGPTGTAGHVLMSNGLNQPPSFQDLEAAVEAVLRKHNLIP